jgi:hypothetical protein
MIDNFINKTVFITGNSKNAGKTTFLNYLLPNTRKIVNSLAYLTIGIDGEQEDMIFGNLKPGIHAETEDYIVTCDSILSASDGNFEIIEVFPFSNKLGTLVLVKTLRPGSVELIGPENNAQLNYIINYLRIEKNIKTIFIDGAINRITQITSAENSEFIYVMKVASKDIMKSINQIKKLSLIKNFSVISNNKNLENNIFICDGALTSLRVSKIPDTCKNILVNDFTKIFLSWNELNNLLKNKTIFYKEKFHLSCISVNLYDINRNDFNYLLSSNNINEKIEFNPYEHI